MPEVKKQPKKERMFQFSRFGEPMKVRVCGEEIDIMPIRNPAVMEERTRLLQGDWSSDDHKLDRSPIPMPTLGVYNPSQMGMVVIRTLMAGAEVDGEKMGPGEAAEMYMRDPEGVSFAVYKILDISGFTDQSMERAKKTGGGQEDGGDSSSAPAAPNSDATPESLKPEG